MSTIVCCCLQVAVPMHLLEVGHFDEGGAARIVVDLALLLLHLYSGLVTEPVRSVISLLCC